jgi:predicted amidohydrolase
VQPALERYQQLLSTSVIATLNAALCERHLGACPPSEELRRECGKVGCGVCWAARFKRRLCCPARLACSWPSLLSAALLCSCWFCAAAWAGQGD